MVDKKMDVITFGESMVLFNPDSKGPLRYIHTFTKALSGAESNVAIALARLEHKVGWFSKLGDDEFGRYIECFIRGEGVDISRVIKDEERSTGLLFKERFAHVNPNVYYYRRNSAASYLSPEDIDYEYIKNAKILHVTGITPALSESARETVTRVVDFAKENGVIFSFDPNIRLKLWSKEEAKPVILDLCKKADILFPGIDEAEMLLGIEDPREVIKTFHEMGPDIVALKLGKEGCMLSNRKEQHFVNGYTVKTMEDSVGAGDGFAAGFLSGMLRNKNLKECGEYANGVGAMATLVKGDVEGLPTYDQLLTFIDKKEYVDR
ncbi:2-dehydro-3-deoxygluconokinase [Vallitalea longa]|uniref:2-dehydro-3-deoxygluconokinase n=1 Tax=Vallitalea longa TaxID=2936439 RepID=A0A9W6DGR0_9FIRM|nr:sugar kinase [Vallitalea longa]GKX30797.1 2-dehydro-3-deoxygluconokinase [Vallitalea longa]